MTGLAALSMDHAPLRVGDCSVASIWLGGEGKERPLLPEVKECEKPEGEKQHRQAVAEVQASASTDLGSNSLPLTSDFVLDEFNLSVSVTSRVKWGVIARIRSAICKAMSKCTINSAYFFGYYYH